MKIVNPLTTWMYGFLQGISIRLSELDKIKKQNPPLKFAHSKYSDKLKCFICVIQVSGKRLFFEVEPSTLLNNEHYLYSLSQTDVKIVTEIKEKNKILSKYTIIEFNSAVHDQPESFVVLDRNDGKLKKVYMSNDANKSVLSKLSPKDAYTLGYAQSNIDNGNLRKIKANAVSSFKESRNIVKANKLKVISFGLD